jgi:hypothetical protein
MEALLLGPQLCFAAGVALLICGATLAWSSVSFAKRVAGVLLALMGAIVAAAALGAPQQALLGGAAVLFCYAAIGVSVLVRLQEAYGSTQIDDIDAADAEKASSEPAA